jgi:hypothetical protein
MPRAMKRHPMSPETEEERRAARLAAAEKAFIEAVYAECHRRWGCAAKVCEDCRERNEHAHHRQMRSEGGPTTPRNLLNVCRPCHDWIHAHPAASYELRLLVPSWADPHQPEWSYP